MLDYCLAVLRGDWCSDDEADARHWFAAAEQALAAALAIAEAPEQATPTPTDAQHTDDPSSLCLLAVLVLAFNRNTKETLKMQTRKPTF